ncbi:hypothetical protein [Yinghuangia seranimata]|uniref:hypothetical protein n=1 Tax=Yinghuangia seranimata TaxID=408067 RepID=UPI00248ADD5E|nr:hypothetical protein [Yinghuangia seranimata]MDI2127371.1 hypothetical protein [Yinghuangia seranimata]
MSTRLVSGRLASTAVALAVGALALTACKIPGQDDAKDDKASSAPTATASAAPASSPAADKPTDAATAAPTATKKPSAPATTGASGTHVLVSAARTGGYTRLGAEVTDVPLDPGDIQPGMNVLVAAYGKTASGPREVLLEGIDGLPAMDGKRFEHMIREMVDYVNRDGGSVPQGATMTTYAAGPLGGTLECMPAQDAYPAAICGWADKNTVLVAYFDKLSADAAAKKLQEMRADLEK